MLTTTRGVRGVHRVVRQSYEVSLCPRRGRPITTRGFDIRYVPHAAGLGIPLIGMYWTIRTSYLICKI